MSTIAAQLAARAHLIVQLGGFNVSRIYRRGDMWVANAVFHTQHGSLTFELLVGRMSASEHIKVTDLTVFSPAVQEVIDRTELLQDDLRFAVFPKDVGQTYILEMLLLTEADCEAVLALTLNDTHFDQRQLIIRSSEQGQLQVFHSEPCASFGEVGLESAATEQFTDLHPVGVVYLRYRSPNGYHLVRVYDHLLNKQFLEFLRDKFDGAYTHISSEVVS